MFRTYVLDEIIDWVWDTLHAKMTNEKIKRFLRVSKAKTYRW